MINNVVLIGRLAKDVDMRYTQSGVSVGSFSVAVERNFKNAQGERETDFINCVIWRKAAENFAKFTRKGSLVGVEGSIQTRNYENNQGQRVYVTEVLVENFTLLESKKDSQNNQNTSQGGFQNANDGNYTQSNQNSSQGNLNANANGGSINVTDDDLPF